MDEEVAEAPCSDCRNRLHRRHSQARFHQWSEGFHVWKLQEQCLTCSGDAGQCLVQAVVVVPTVHLAISSSVTLEMELLQELSQKIHQQNYLRLPDL